MISLETSLQKPPAQENLAVQTRQVANLTASRQILLTSFRTSEQTVATLRSDLSALRSELDASTSASAQRIGELEAQVEELDEVKDELATQKKELERLEKGGKKGDLERQKELEKERKELEKERKELEKERSKREKLENEVKALKASPLFGCLPVLGSEEPLTKPILTLPIPADAAEDDRVCSQGGREGQGVASESHPGPEQQHHQGNAPPDFQRRAGCHGPRRGPCGCRRTRRRCCRV